MKLERYNKKTKMTSIQRLKITIFAIAFVALLLLSAVFGVSFAAWVSSENVTSDVDSSIGLFYVEASNDTVVVRQSNGSCDDSNSYTYKNYVCVYKATEYVDMAFVNFGLELKSGDEDTLVKEFTVMRALADENGIPIGDKTALSVLNFSADKPISEFSESQYNLNPYVQLEFESGAGQYYALDVTIVTSAEVLFDFKAVATPYDNHECTDPNTLFLGFGWWTRSYTTKMIVTKDQTTGEFINDRPEEDIDCTIDVILTAGTSFKMIRSNSAGDGIEVYYRPEKGDLSVHSDYTAVQGGGDIKITATGLYRVRFYGNAYYEKTHDNGAIEYRITNVDVSMIRKIDDELTETSEPGVYVVGIFNDDKTCEEYRIVDDYNNVEGFLALDYAKFKSIRVGDSFRVVELDSNGAKTELSRATVAVGRDGEKKLIYDTFTQTAYSGYKSYRFVVDLNGVVPSSNMTIGYRRIINDLNTNAGISQLDDLASAETAVLGFQFETGLQSFTDGGKTLYYADIPYDEQIGGKSANGYYIYSGTAGDIVSVTVLGSGGNSYNINKFSCGFTQLDGGYSYRITATGIPTVVQSDFIAGDCNNWIGNIRQGRSGNAQDFALDNAGYLVVDVNGDTISNLVRTESGETPFTAEIKKTDVGAQKFVVFLNGNSVVRSSYNKDEIPRITRTLSMPYEFGTIGSEKALGNYFLAVGASKTYISYLSQDVSTEVVSGVAWDDSWQEGYYAVGEFSRWKAYPEYMLTPSDTVKTDIVFSHNRIITVDDAANASEISKADLYKIVYAYNNNGTSAFVWYGKANSYDPDDAYLYNGGYNISAISTTLTFSMKSTFGNEITVADGNYYVVGEFSDWKAYGTFKLMPDESGYLTATSQFFGAGDQFKIFRNGVYYGIAPTTDNPDGNVTVAADDKIYFDAYRLVVEEKTDLTVLDESYFNIGVEGGIIADDRIRLFLTFTGNHSPHLWAWGKNADGVQVDYASGVDFMHARNDEKLLLKEVAPKIWAIEVEKGRNGIIVLTGFMFVNSSYGNLCTSDIAATATWGGCQVYNYPW